MTRTEFDDLIQQQSRKLYGFAFRILRNQEEAEDVVQEIFIKLWKMGEKLDDYRSVDALATAMTKNYCIDLLRKQKHNFRGEVNINDYQNLTSPSPHEQMENRESGEILNTIIAGLPEIYRVVIRMREIEGISYEEIAEKTDQNINTLRGTLSRARKIIRDEYKKFQYERRGIEKVNRKVL
ncbi:MAG: sigma-70 family RNA polymerase sigma factor [Bacteroidales bacterium]|nr:sigma-70 family RNA polymerase sigma factor [Bacteroidales bacterium]